MTYSKEEILSRCNAICKNTLMETLEIEFVDVSEDSLTARMPVTSKVHQPDGVLHGGATVALAESVGSAAAFVVLKDSDAMVRGIEIAANHVKGVRSGYVYAKATVLHKGRTTQLWQIRVTNEADELVSMIKFTTISLPKA
ncbi:PaaI family thioesterase [Aureisphaera galaxeae]|uniref:PaaI family thioesterase n=1 Tax=Aureisphaera galaxeae TaxID=1538023 RepID=UPI002350B117|nr:PaaI family thioesterase [Aureisphaera galaxeae]MDC8004637.1 PaaI family thioesterase [Aureisphaera galaxeae]